MYAISCKKSEGKTVTQTDESYAISLISIWQYGRLIITENLESRISSLVKDSQFQVSNRLQKNYSILQSKIYLEQAPKPVSIGFIILRISRNGFFLVTIVHMIVKKTAPKIILVMVTVITNSPKFSIVPLTSFISATLLAIILPTPSGENLK